MTKYTKDTNQLPTVAMGADTIRYFVGEGVLETPALWEEYGLVQLPEPINEQANESDTLFADKDINGNWFCEWRATEYYQQLTDDRILDRDARIQRNQLLKASDWTQLADAPFTSEQRQLWTTYRQALRDLPSQTGYPRSIVWPTPPQQ